MMCMEYFWGVRGVSVVSFYFEEDEVEDVGIWPKLVMAMHPSQAISTTARPMGVKNTSRSSSSESIGDGGTDGIVEPEYVAEVVTAAMRDGRFLILPHPEVQTYVERKAADPDRWLKGMRRLRARSLDLLDGS